MRASLARYPRVTLEPGFPPAAAPAVGNGVVWLPNGQARACDLQPLGDEIVATISDANAVRRVAVTIAGRVTVQ